MEKSENGNDEAILIVLQTPNSSSCHLPLLTHDPLPFQSSIHHFRLHFTITSIPPCRRFIQRRVGVDDEAK